MSAARLGRSAIVGLVAVLAATGCSRPQAPRENPVEAAALAAGPSLQSRARTEGRQVFTTYCAPCHGDAGAGDGQNASRLAPRPPDLRAALPRLSPADLRRIVESGTRAVGRTPLCPPHGRTLGAERVEVLLRYLASIGR